MKAKLVLAALIISLLMPAPSHAFGLFQYLFDAVSNQLGLDRGALPKVVPNTPTDTNMRALPMNQHPDRHRVYIQAEGF